MKYFIRSSIMLLVLLLLAAVAGAGTWEQLDVTSAPLISGHTCVFHASDQSMYLLGDAFLTNASIYWINLGGTTRNTVVVASSDTVKRYGHSAIMDTTADRIIVFAGNTGLSYNLAVTNALYSFDIANNNTWVVLASTGTDVPAARSAHSAVFDPQFNRMIVYGGRDVDQTVLSDTYILDLSVTPAQWSKANLSYDAPARWQAAAIFDPVRKRMVIFGGMKANNEPTNELWALDLSAASLTNKSWTQIVPGNTASSDLARTAHIMAYDNDNDRLLVTMGWAPLTLTEAFYDTTYAFDLNTKLWSQISPGPDVPPQRRNASGIYDTVSKKMIIFGGASGNDANTVAKNDMYALEAVTKWASGKSRSEVYNYPNPFNSGTSKTTIKFYCDSASSVKVTIYSLIGELVKDWTVSGIKGINSLEWDGANGDGEKVESGGYICVIDNGGSESKFKIGVIR